MNTDLIILYLACGSPLGVYQITSSRAPRSAVDWAGIIFAFIFWPVFAAFLLIARLRAPHQIDQSRLDRIRTDIEQIAFTGASMTRLFDFRDVFYRFTGLVETANADHGRPRGNEIFEVAGHDNKTLASRCLARRNRDKLAFHRERARDEFIGVVSSAAADTAKEENLFRLTTELSELIRDTKTAQQIRSLSSLAETTPPDAAVDRNSIYPASVGK